MSLQTDNAYQVLKIDYRAPRYPWFCRECGHLYDEAELDHRGHRDKGDDA